MSRTSIVALSRRAAFIVLVGVFAGCPPVPPNADGGQDAGGCSEGQVGCACTGGTTCTTGECVGGSCVDCVRGAMACACRMNSTCETGLRCSATNVCETCPAGQSGCACGAGDVCGSGLKCELGTCVADTCVAGASSCPCRSTDPKCDGTNYCDSSQRCQGCTPDVVGCGCGASSTCSGGLVCNAADMKCRAALRCADLLDAGTCVQRQTCTEATSGNDALCVANSCETGFKWDGRAMNCVQCVSADCSNEPTCASTDGGIGAMCDAQHRTCVSSGTPVVSYCDACVSGYSLVGGNCVAAPRCAGLQCTPTQYCSEDTGRPACTDLPCPSGQATPAGATPNCTACTISCGAGGGKTGRVWPIRTVTGGCICETEEGYFRESGASGDVKPCDADGDGWTNQKANDTTITSDPALRLNARCVVRGVTAVRLVDEFGTAADVKVCDGNTLQLVTPPAGLLDGGREPAPADAGSCTASRIRLLETELTDTPGQPVFALNNKFPVFGGDAGRALEASELNALTKACVADNADFNNDGNSDILEYHAQSRPLLPADTQLLLQFAYFMELNTSYFEASADAGVDAGFLVIKERSRCDNAFPLHYAATGVSLPDGGATDRYVSAIDAGSVYWRNCDRRRPAAFDSSKPTFDFGEFSCAAANGSCDWQEVAHRTLIGPTNPRTTLPRAIGVCDLAGAKPFDNRWRGMLHHSQFRCANITTNASDVSVSPMDVPSKYVVNVCRAKPCASATDPSCRSKPGVGAQTSDPRIECTALTNAPPVVAFVAVQYPTAYATENDYVAGCINEDAESKLPTGTYQSYLCPYPEYSPFAGRINEFGRYSCYGRPANSLWAPSDGGVQRATLRWSATSTQTNNGFWRNP